MSKQGKTVGVLSLGQRKQIFAALVGLQDSARIDVSCSRHMVAKRFHMEELQVRQIQEEGIQEEWPPL